MRTMRAAGWKSGEQRKWLWRGRSTNFLIFKATCTRCTLQGGGVGGNGVSLEADRTIAFLKYIKKAMLFPTSSLLFMSRLAVALLDWRPFVNLVYRRYKTHFPLQLVTASLFKFSMGEQSIDAGIVWSLLVSNRALTQVVCDQRAIIWSIDAGSVWSLLVSNRALTQVVCDQRAIIWSIDAGRVWSLLVWSRRTIAPFIAPGQTCNLADLRVNQLTRLQSTCPLFARTN